MLEKPFRGFLTLMFLVYQIEASSEISTSSALCSFSQGVALSSKNLYSSLCPIMRAPTMTAPKERPNHSTTIGHVRILTIKYQGLELFN
jgi:hypothetical protein